MDGGESESVRSSSPVVVDFSAASSSIEATSEDNAIFPLDDLLLPWDLQGRLYSLSLETEANEIGGQSIPQSSQAHDDRRMKRKHQQVTCEPCNKTFKRKQEYKRHNRDVHAIPRQCPFCHIKWTRPDKIKTHIKNAHKESVAPDVLLKIEALCGQRLTQHLDGLLQGANGEAAFQ